MSHSQDGDYDIRSFITRAEKCCHLVSTHTAFARLPQFCLQFLIHSTLYLFVNGPRGRRARRWNFSSEIRIRNHHRDWRKRGNFVPQILRRYFRQNAILRL